MSFAVPAESYDRFMGRYSVPLGPKFADAAGIEAGQRVIDVGCGPGALTGELVARVGAANVVAVDPSESFVEAARSRNPEVDVRQGTAEQLPFEDHAFDAALAQLVVHFMADPARGIAEMKRVTKPGGVVAACVWDHGGDRGPLSPLWVAARALDPTSKGESELVGSHEGDLERLLRDAGLNDVEETALAVEVAYGSFDEWWEPYTYGVGPAGQHVAGLDPAARGALRESARGILGDGPFVITAFAWTGVGRA